MRRPGRGQQPLGRASGRSAAMASEPRTTSRSGPSRIAGDLGRHRLAGGGGVTPEHGPEDGTQHPALRLARVRAEPAGRDKVCRSALPGLPAGLAVGELGQIGGQLPHRVRPRRRPGGAARPTRPASARRPPCAGRAGGPGRARRRPPPGPAGAGTTASTVNSPRTPAAGRPRSPRRRLRGVARDLGERRGHRQRAVRAEHGGGVDQPAGRLGTGRVAVLDQPAEGPRRRQQLIVEPHSDGGNSSSNALACNGFPCVPYRSRRAATAPMPSMPISAARSRRSSSSRPRSRSTVPRCPLISRRKLSGRSVMLSSRTAIER